MRTVISWLEPAMLRIAIWQQRCPFPLRHDAFPSASDFPLFSKKFQTLWKIFKILPFPEKFLDFHPPKLMMTFFYSLTTNSPYFPCFSTFPSVLEKFTCFLHTLCISFPPYFDHECIYASPNARTGRPCLAVPVSRLDNGEGRC